MTAYATVADLMAGWRVLSAPEQDVASTLLLRATAYVTSMLTRRGVTIDQADEVQAENLKTVTCNVVKRAMSSGAVSGMGQASQAIGSTNVSVQYSNPDGSFYLSHGDKELLGLTGNGGRIGWVSA